MTASDSPGDSRPAPNIRDGDRSRGAHTATAGEIATLAHAFTILRSALDAMVDGVLIADASGGIFGFNRAFAEIWQIPPEVLEQSDDAAALEAALRFIPDPEPFMARVNELYAAPEAEAMDVIRLNDGRIIERHSVPQRMDGAIIGRVWTFRDVSERVAAETALRASMARFRAVFDHAATGIALIDRDGRIIETNTALHTVFGEAGTHLVGRRLYHLVPEEDAGDLASTISSLGSGDGASLTIEQRFIRGDGEVTWVALTMSRATLLDRPDEALGIIAMVQDISTRKSLEERLTHQASHDPLTNLANRTLFKQRLSLALQRAAHRDRIVVMFLDLDDFKSVNDSLGHGAGDELLVAAAGRLLNATRGSDTVARFGGDEFAILLENVRDDEETRVIAERITRAMRQPIAVGGESVTVSVSIGIARAYEDADGTDELLRNADVAMYSAKSAGKSRYQFFEPSMHAAVLDRIGLEADLRRALASREFALVYQPYVRLDDREVIGVEALVRWHHPQRGTLLPGDFLGVAEETGIIVPIGRWALYEACRQAHEWWRDLPDSARMNVAVNVSARQLADPSFVADVADALADTGLTPHRLVLEIAESVVMRRTDTTLERLRDLKALGVGIAIDDFGTGYSSLGYLQQFPIDVLKIDRGFIEGMHRDAAGAALARTIIGLGWTLGMATVAEGVETVGQETALRELGCGIAQGYLFGRPLPAADTTGLVQPAPHEDEPE